MAPRGANYQRADRDLYPTPEWVTRTLISQIRFSGVLWEPCSGNGQMSRVLAETGATVYRSDIHPIGDTEARALDFIAEPCPWPIKPDIITNPPYGKQSKLAEKFIRRSFDVVRPHGGKIAMLLPVDFDSAKTRAWAFRDCAAFWGKMTLLDRIKWFDQAKGEKKKSPSQNHAWFIWDFSAAQYPRQIYGVKR